VFDSIGGWWDGLVDSWVKGFDTFIGWIKEALDWLGQITGFDAVSDWIGSTFGDGQASARTLAAPAAFANGQDPAGAMMLRSFAPMTLALTSPDAGGPLAVRQQRAGDIYNITINGALDPDAVGGQVSDILRRRGARRGSSVAAGAY
jgi:hypothetical protein